MLKPLTYAFFTTFLILTSCSSPPNSPPNQQSPNPDQVSALQHQKEEALSQVKQAQEAFLSLQQEHERTLLVTKQMKEELNQIQNGKVSAEHSASTATSENVFLKGITVAVGMTALVIGAGIGSKAKNASKKGGTTKNGKKSPVST